MSIGQWAYRAARPAGFAAAAALLVTACVTPNFRVEVTPEQLQGTWKNKLGVTLIFDKDKTFTAKQVHKARQLGSCENAKELRSGTWRFYDFNEKTRKAEYPEDKSDLLELEFDQGDSHCIFQIEVNRYEGAKRLRLCMVPDPDSGCESEEEFLRSKRRSR